MPHCNRRFSSFLLTIAAVLAFAPGAASAFDCTPIDSFTCAGGSHYGQLQDNSVPGEMLCGFDYTGWVFNVFTLTLATDNQPFIEVHNGPGSNLESHLLVLDGCPGGACVASDVDGTGDPQVFECLPAGTYTLVFAANSTANEVFAAGLTGCQGCVPVSVDDATWGAIKSTFR